MPKDTQDFKNLFNELLNCLTWFVDNKLSVPNVIPRVPNDAHPWAAGLIKTYNQIINIPTGTLSEEQYKKIAIRSMGFLKNDILTDDGVSIVDVDDRGISLAAIVSYMALSIVDMGYAVEKDLIPSDSRDDLDTIEKLIYCLICHVEYEASDDVQSTLNNLDFFLTLKKPDYAKSVFLPALMMYEATETQMVAFFSLNPRPEVILWFFKIESMDDLRKFLSDENLQASIIRIFEDLSPETPDSELISWFFKIETTDELKIFPSYKNLQSSITGFREVAPSPALTDWIFNHAKTVTELEKFLNDEKLQSSVTKFLGVTPLPVLGDWIFNHAEKKADLEKLLNDVELRSAVSKFLNFALQPPPVLIDWIFNHAKTRTELVGFLNDEKLRSNVFKFLTSVPSPSKALINWVFSYVETKDQLDRLLSDTKLQFSVSKLLDLAPLYYAQSVFLQALINDTKFLTQVQTMPFFSSNPNGTVISWLCRLATRNELDIFLKDKKLQTTITKFFDSMPNVKLVEWIFNYANTSQSLEACLSNVQLKTLSRDFFFLIPPPRPQMIKWTFQAKTLDKLISRLSIPQPNPRMVDWIFQAESQDELESYLNNSGLLNLAAQFFSWVSAQSMPNSVLVTWVFSHAKTSKSLKDYLGNEQLRILSTKFFLSNPSEANVKWIFQANTLVELISRYWIFLAGMKDKLDRHLEDDELLSLVLKFFSSGAAQSKSGTELGNWIFERAKTIEDLKSYLSNVQLRDLSTKFFLSQPNPAIEKWVFQAGTPDELNCRLEDDELLSLAAQFFSSGSTVAGVFSAQTISELKEALRNAIAVSENDSSDTDSTSDDEAEKFEDIDLSMEEKQSSDTKKKPGGLPKIEGLTSLNLSFTKEQEPVGPVQGGSWGRRVVMGLFSPRTSAKNGESVSVNGSQNGNGHAGNLTDRPMPNASNVSLDLSKGWGKIEGETSSSGNQTARRRATSTTKGNNERKPPPLERSTSGKIFGSSANKSMEVLPVHPKTINSSNSVPSTPVVAPSGSILKTAPGSAPPSLTTPSPSNSPRPNSSSPLANVSRSPRDLSRAMSTVRKRTESILTNDPSSAIRNLSTKFLPPSWSDDMKSKFAEGVKNISTFESFLNLLKSVDIPGWLESFSKEPDNTVGKIREAFDLLYKAKVGKEGIFLHPFILLKIAAQPPHAPEVATVIIALYTNEMNRLKCQPPMQEFCQNLGATENKCPNFYLVCYDLINKGLEEWADKIFVAFEDWKEVVVTFHMLRYENKKPKEKQLGVLVVIELLPKMQREFDGFYSACLQLEAAKIPDWTKSISEIIEKYDEQKEGGMEAFIRGLFTAIDILESKKCLNSHALLSMMAIGQAIETGREVNSNVMQKVAFVIIAIHGLKLKLEKEWPSDKEKQLSDNWQTAFLEPKHVGNVASIVVMIPEEKLTKDFLEVILSLVTYSSDILKICIALYTVQMEITFEILTALAMLQCVENIAEIASELEKASQLSGKLDQVYFDAVMREFTTTLVCN